MRQRWLFIQHEDLSRKGVKVARSTLGSCVINNMVDVITENSSALLHKLYFDNFFTNYYLMSDLTKIDVRATSTISESRTAGANQKMISSKQLQKQERKCLEYCCNGTLCIAKWHDNSVVTIASNWKSHIPVYKVRHREKGGVNEVPQPHLINSYNKGMGGVDFIDCLLQVYRPTMRGKK